LIFVKLVGDRPAEPPTFAERVRPDISSGEKSKGRDIVAARKTLQLIEKEQRQARPEEWEALPRFCGFGPVALSIFPNTGTGEYEDDSWEALGEELKSLLTPEEYASARKTAFNAFYASPVVIDAMHQAMARLGVPNNALVLEPGCGTGNFMLPGKR
jgi:hypothetical protein